MELTNRFRPLAVGLVVVSLLLGGTALVVAEPATQDRERGEQPPGAVADGPPASGGFAGAVQQVDPDTVLLNVALDADGDAAWTVEYRVRLDDANTTEAFEAYRADIDGNETDYATQFADRLLPTVRTAENTTGRDMAVRNVTVEATRRQLPQEYGVVTYRFAWMNFGVTEGDRLAAGDALAGFFLDKETTMTVSWPETYRMESVDPPADATTDDSVTWDGALNFDGEQPRLVMTTAGPTPTTTDTAGSDRTLVPGWSLVLVVLLGIVAVVLAAYWYRQRDDESDGTTGGTDEDETDDGGVPPELLTDEERVRSLLEERGGRVKQQDIAGEFDWTDAKTSQVVTRLREDDDVDVLRIGRENVVSLPDESNI